MMRLCLRTAKAKVRSQWQGQRMLSPLLFVLALCMLLIMPPSALGQSRSPQLEEPSGASAHMALNIDDDSGEITIEMVTSEFTFADGMSTAGPCKEIVAPGYEQSSVPGEPQLPIYVGLVGAPPSGNISIEIRSMESVTLTGNMNICPAPLAAAQPDAGGVTPFVEEPTAPAPDVYALDAFYPQQSAVISELGFMRSQRLARFTLYPFQVDHVTGQLIYHRFMRVAIRFSEGVTQTSGESAVEDEAFERVMRGLLLNYNAARNWRGFPLTGQEVTAWTPPADAYRVWVSQTGIYRLTYDELVAAGFPVDLVDPTQLRMMYNGQEIAIRIVGQQPDGGLGPDSAILFYGEAPKERFAPANVYWLSLQPSQEGLDRSAESGGRRMEEYSNNRAAQASSETMAVTQLHLEENSNYVSSLPMEPGFDHWYGRRITAVGAGLTGQQDIVMDLDPVSSGNVVARLQVALAGNVRGPHHLRILLNRTQIFEGYWEDRTYQTFETTFDHTLLQAGENTLRLQLVNDAPGQTVDMAYIDWAKLTYTRSLQAQDNHVDFTNRGPGNWKYSIATFDKNEVEAYDVTDPTKVRLVLGAVENGRFDFSDYQAAARHYIVSATANQLAPLAIEQANSTDLRATSTHVDYIMIAHPDLVDAIRPLADYRTRHGLNVMVVNLQDIYDQFNYGRASAQAIQDFLKYAYTNWPAPAVRFALLVGDGNYDPLGYLTTSEPSLLPPYLAMVDPDLGETAADNRYAAIVGDDLIPDLSIGRFPAKTPADVTAMVEKTMRYEQAPIDPNWNQGILFVADDLEGGGGAFQNFSNAIADGYIETNSGRLALVPEEYARTKLYLGAGCEDGAPAVQCRQEIVDAVNEGRLFVSYVGHGAKQYWAEEQIFNQDALFQLHNANRLPIMLAMTCLEGFFHEAEANSDAFGEMIVRLPQNGAVASWSPTGFGLASGHDYLETGFFLGLFHQGLTTMGEATTFGKMHMMAHAPANKYDDLLDTFVLFGDPALTVRSAGREPVVDIQHQFLPILMRD